jgi:hypothetical protein
MENKEKNMTQQPAHLACVVRATILVVICATGAGRAASAGESARAQQTRTAPLTKPGNKKMSDETPFYCNLKALSPSERARHHQLAEKLEHSRAETTELPDGYAYRLRSGTISLSELAEWVAAEQRCCPFFDFAIELQRENGPLSLKLTGRPGVKDFMRAEFSIPDAR